MRSAGFRLPASLFVPRLMVSRRGAARELSVFEMLLSKLVGAPTVRWARTQGGPVRAGRAMSTITDPHKVLGIPRGASLAEVKVAYRSMAMQCHPDRNTGSHAAIQFKAVSEAYNHLSAISSAPGSSQSGPSFSSSCAGCGGLNGVSWRPPNAAAWVWSDSNLPELIAILLEETGDERLTQLLQRYRAALLPRKEMLLSIRDYASREQFRTALWRLAERNAREGDQVHMGSPA